MMTTRAEDRPSAPITPKAFSRADIADALGDGWRSFRAVPGTSMLYAALFAVIGLGLLATIGKFGLSPMALPLAGGFMLVAPAVVVGFFRLADVKESGKAPKVSDALRAFTQAPLGLWMLALICAFLFLIWITDAAVLYAVMIGSEHLPFELPWLIRPQKNVIAFELWGSLMGSVLAFVILAISAFSVPLLHYRRSNPVQAIHASVRAVLKNFLVSILWGMILTAATVTAIVLLPMLVVVFPVLAYSGLALYRTVFPDDDEGVASSP